MPNFALLISKKKKKKKKEKRKEEKTAINVNQQQSELQPWNWLETLPTNCVNITFIIKGKQSKFVIFFAIRYHDKASHVFTITFFTQNI